MTETRDGGCRCGRIRFRTRGAPMITMACHCRGCQRMTASAFSLSAAFAPEAFAVTAGAPVEGGVEHGEGPYQHYHCGWCGSWLYTMPPPEAGFVNVRATLFDDPVGLDPFVETQTAEKLLWATTPAPHRFDRFPAMDAFPALVAAYPAWAATR